MEIVTDDQDFTQEWLREGHVLGCVTALKQALRGCKVVPLGAMDYVAVATPAFAQARLTGRSPGGAALLNAHNFRNLSFVAFNRKDDMQSEFVGKAFGLTRVTLRQLFVPSSEGQVRAVLAGWRAEASAWCRACWCRACLTRACWSMSRQPAVCRSSFTGTAGIWPPTCWTR
jgi:LysR family transcriptional regulator (chromosome initiation inhibitor)